MEKLNGIWSGHYTVPDALRDAQPEASATKPYAIEATFSEMLGALEGSMIDLEKTPAMPLRTHFKSNQGYCDEEELARMRQFLRDHPDIWIRSTPAKNAKLKGWVRGRRVSFYKEYEGRQRTVWFYPGGFDESETFEEHPGVVYKGVLNSDRTTLSSIWEVRRHRSFDDGSPPTSSGGFLLQKELREP